jgi:hypothetical protein
MKRIRFYVLILFLLISTITPQVVQAAAGAPGSADFGYGAWLHLDGRYFEEGLDLLGDLRLDWVAIDLDWAAWSPEPDQAADYSTIDQVMKAASASQSAVMISLTNPPAWALTSQGPSAEATARLLASLARRYPNALQAIELFPAANITAGWRAAPDPAAYARLYADVKNRLKTEGIALILAAGGLTPLDSENQDGVSDLDFLRGMYAAGAAQWMDVLSLHLPRLSGSPLAAPGAKRGQVLRHYEEIRQIMIENHHQSGLIWITQLASPDGTIESGDWMVRKPQRQAEWLQQAIIQIRSQLYIGIVFGCQLIPPEPSAQDFSKDSLLLKPNSYHPFYSALKALIQQARVLSAQKDSGKPKDSSLLKSNYKT